MVSTADGSARSPDGLSGGISSASDRLVFGTIRGLADVIVVGAETVRKEGYGPPKSRSALVDLRRHNRQADVPRIAVFTKSGKLDTKTSLFSDPTAPPIVFAPQSLPENRQAELGGVADLRLVGAQEVDLHQAVASLHQDGLNRIVCEGGPSLLGQFAAAELLHELCLTISPLLFGGSLDGHMAPRVLAGPALPNPPQPMSLVHVLEGDGALFLRYVVTR